MAGWVGIVAVPEIGPTGAAGGGRRGRRDDALISTVHR